MRHNWDANPDDDRRLMDAVAVVESMGQIVKHRWSAVAARLAPDLMVSGDSCHARWDRIKRMRADAEAHAEAERKAAEQSDAEQSATVLPPDQPMEETARDLLRQSLTEQRETNRLLSALLDCWRRS